MPFEALERPDRRVDAVDEIAGGDVAKVVRGQRRQQAHADVGRRRAARQPRRVAGLLIVVGQEPGIGLA